MDKKTEITRLYRVLLAFFWSPPPHLPAHFPIPSLARKKKRKQKEAGAANAKRNWKEKHNKSSSTEDDQQKKRKESDWNPITGTRPSIYVKPLRTKPSKTRYAIDRYQTIKKTR